MTTMECGLRPQIRETLSKVTGHRPCDLEPDMFLESDLGIDSIKMVELTQTLLQLIPDERREQFLGEVPSERMMQVQTLAELEALLHGWGEEAPQPSAEGSADAASPVAVPAPQTSSAFQPMAVATTAAGAAAAESPGACAFAGEPRAAGAPAADPGADLSLRLFELVSGVTGHRPDDLDLDQYLESDLGVDSIKMMELAQTLLQLVPEPRRDAFLAEVPTEQLLHIQTLRQLHAVFLPWQDAPAAAPSAGTLFAGGPAPAASTSGPGAASDDEPSQPVPAAPVELEMLHAQIPFLVSHWAVSTCSLCSHVRVQGPFDLERARRAWTALLDRHPALRSYFSIPAEAAYFKDYRLLAHERIEAPALQLEDLRRLDRARQDEAIAAEVERCVNFQWPLEEWPLHRFFVWRLADDVYEVFFTNHHLVSDGLGNQQVMREFLALYEAQQSGRPAQLPPATTVEQYRATVAALNAWHDPAEEKAAAEFLRAQGKQSFFWNPTGAARPARRAHCRNYRFQLEPDATQALLQLTAELRLPMNTLLVGAYLRAIANFGPAPESIFVNIPTSGRVYPQVDAAGIVGCFAQNLTLGFACPREEEDWAALLRRVHHEIEHAIAQGYDRAQNRQTALFARDKLRLDKGRISEAQCGLIRSSMKSNLYLPYIGNTHIGAAYGALQVLDYQAATVTNAGTLDTVIELFHERMEMTTNYDANTYNVEFVARAAEAFLAQLRSLAAYRPRRIAPAQAVRDAVSDALAGSQLRQVAEEVMHQPLSEADLTKDLEADLGLDSLERIRIVSRLQQFMPEVDRAALLACRTLAEMAAHLPGRGAPAAERSPAAVPLPATARPEAVRSGPGPVSFAAADAAAIPYVQIVQQCRRTPESLAVLSAEGSLTYAELDRQSNRLAHYLRAHGVGRGTLVGVMLNRGPRFMVALLAILKAGGAYVPLDPDYPTARLAYILKHARIENLLSESAVQTQLSQCLAGPLPLRNVIHLDEPQGASAGSYRSVGLGAWSACADTELPVVSTPDDPMVVLYTSGSTGNPKGVVLAHRGYANRLDWHQQLFQLRHGERVAQKTSICFDISVWELLWPLQLGGVVCPVSTAILRDPWQLARWVRDTDIHVMHFVPSLFGEFLTAIEQQPTAFPSLRHLVFSGEALPVAYVRRWMTIFGNRVGLTNLYGPTEASIDVSAHTVAEIPSADTPRIPIGREMPQVHLRVLDESMRPVPQGTLGELWIGGLQLAHGYLHDPERTAESFKPNPFPEIPGATLYRTGDLAVQLPNGEFDYRGRVDSQVKIRGYRVELGEIESVLGSHPAIREAAVLAVEFGEGNLRLIACVAGDTVEPRALREFLGTRLPHYMIPHRFDWLPALPRNQNGKIDRKALKQSLQSAAAAPQAGPPAGSGAGASPSPATAEPDARTPRGAEQALGPAQQWLLRYFDPPYRWAGFTRFTYLQPLDIEVFNRALARMAQRHPALRSRFHRENAQWRQTFPDSDAPVAAEYYDGSTLSAQERDEQMRELLAERVDALQLEGGGALWSVLVVKEAESRYDICVLGHHILSDMFGNGILFKDLWRTYAELLAGETEGDAAGRDAAAGNPQTFVDYLRDLEKEREPATLARHAEYWTSRFPADAPFRLPFDHHKGENVESSSASELVELSSEDCAGLQRARAHVGCSLYPLLMAPLYRMLSEWSGLHRVVLSHRTHGRDLGEGRRYFDAVGNFAINYPIAVDVRPQKSAAELAREIAQTMDTVPLKGASYDLVADRLPQAIYPDNRLTPVRANYLGNRDTPKSRLFEFRGDELDKRYAPPDQKRTALIEVFFSGRDGTMQVEFNYSSHFHLPATIRRWARRYVELVRATIAQCEEATATPAAANALAPTSMSSAARGARPANGNGHANGAAAFNGSGTLNGTGTLNGAGAANSAAYANGTGARNGAGGAYALSGSAGAQSVEPHRPATAASAAPSTPRLNGSATVQTFPSRPPALPLGALSGKVAIVTGAGRGIGLSIATRLASQGARVALVSRSAAPLESALKEVQALSPESIAITADVTSREEVEAMVQKVIAQLGGIDILINNAGANRSGLLAESEPGEWRAIIDINLMATFLCCRFALPHMLERRAGKIVNLSSVAGVIGYPLFSAYSAAKHGILGLTKALAEEVKQKNIQVNAVCPAFVDTRMTPQAFRTISMPTEQVADVVLFLALPASAGITGEAINIFGRQDMYAYGSEKLNVVKAMTKDFRPGVQSCG